MAMSVGLLSGKGVSRKSCGQMKVPLPQLPCCSLKTLSGGFCVSPLELEAHLGLESQMEMPSGTGRCYETAKDMLYWLWPRQGQLAACAQIASSPFPSAPSPSLPHETMSPHISVLQKTKQPNKKTQQKR